MTRLLVHPTAAAAKHAETYDLTSDGTIHVGVGAACYGLAVDSLEFTAEAADIIGQTEHSIEWAKRLECRVHPEILVDSSQLGVRGGGDPSL